MVDVVATNKKLRDRALRLVMRLTQARDEQAHELLQAADGSVKVAVVMSVRGVDADDARTILSANEGSLRRSL